MEIRFHRDPETGLPHIYQHGVTEEEVRQVLATRRGEDRAGSGHSRVKSGQTPAGRYLRVIYVLDEPASSTFVITAYDLRGKPLAAFRRRQRRRPRW